MWWHKLKFLCCIIFLLAAFGCSAVKIGQLDEKALELWEQVVNHRRLSARSGLRVLKVARSLADLHDQDKVNKNVIAETMCFRSFDCGDAKEDFAS